MAEAQPDDAVISGVNADELAKLVGDATDEQIATGMQSENRKQVLDEIFRRMADHVEPERSRDTKAVVHFKILDRPEGGYDHYEVVLENGACTASDNPSRDARVTFKIPPVEFIRLVSGNASGPALFMTGKLKIEGDVMFAAQLTSLFKIPKV